MIKEKQAEIVISEEDLTELYTEETLLKSHLLHTTKVSAEKAEAVKNAKLKSSCLAVVLSAFLGLFGAGSFYLGYWKRGICKILFNVVLPVALGIVFLFWLAPTYNAYHITADETSDMVAYKTLNAYYVGYSDAYNDVMNLFGNIDDNNHTLKNVYEYVTEEEDLQTDLVDAAETFASVLTNGFLQNVKSLRALGEIVSEEDYKSIKESSLSSEIIETLDILTDTAQINNVIYTVENLTVLSIDKLNNVAEDLNVLSKKLDGLTSLRDTDDLFAAAAAINQTLVTDRLTENVQSMTEVIAVLENLQSFIDDVVLKYQTLTGQVYGQTAGEGDKSLSQTVAELIASLDSKNDKDKELIAKLTALKNKLDGFSVSDIED
ncbi:MAG: TM2 domain-containing protein, partial [Clostridia bacterium]|nr:TM2 domain-containing protein [Clostridia bacterium]